MRRIGIEASATSLRAVVMRRAGWGIARCVEVPWDPEEPDAGVAALRAQCGHVDSIALAVGLGFTPVVRVDLPPAPHEERERMIALEPERFFVSAEPLETALAPDSDVAFGVPRQLLDGWLTALSTWAPVTRVDPAPVALARADRSATGTFLMDADAETHGVVTVDRGRLVAARRVRADDEVSQATGLPAPAGVPVHYLAASGALAGEDASQLGTLWAPSRRRTARRMLARQTATALLAAVAGLVLAGAAFDQWRERTLVALENEAERLTTEAGPALAAQQRLALLSRESEIARAVISQRANPAAALAAIGTALPQDVVVTVARSNGSAWQVDGTARSAASLVPSLDGNEVFSNVRSLGASSRFLDGSRSRETFSVAFDVRPIR